MFLSFIFDLFCFVCLMINDIIVVLVVGHCNGRCLPFQVEGMQQPAIAVDEGRSLSVVFVPPL